VVFTLALPPAGRSFCLTASDVKLMAELRASAGLSSLGAAEFCDLVMGALLHAAARAPLPPGAAAAAAAAAEASRRRAAAGDRGTPILTHAWNAALLHIVPSHSLAPARKRELYLALTTLFFVAEQYAGGGGEAEGAAGIRAAELATALLFLCEGSKTEKLGEAFRLAAGEGGALAADGVASLLRGAIANLAAVRSPVHVEAESAAETEAMDALADSVRLLADRVVREAGREAPGHITFGELCEWYNSGGAVHLGFLELLDWKKVAALPAATAASAAAAAAAQ
jgi:hypothetical protein